jgi:hypothetical protein
MESFQGSFPYKPLYPHSSDIRLLTIEPGNVEGEIFCHIRHESLDSKPVYEALSYVWGNPHNTIFVNVEGDHFPVAANLEIALRYLRDEQEERILWIDAICIYPDRY